jgi:phosphohistidine phosphatase
MALTLYVLRHAKSGKDNPHLADFDRPLNERGYREAEEMANLVIARAWQPERILCSSSQRTRETLAPLLGLLKSNATIELTRRVYDATAETLLDVIRKQSGAASLMLIGHNPGLEELARALPGSGDGPALARLRTMFPPASLAVISFDIADWSDITPGDGRLDAFEVPADVL